MAARLRLSASLINYERGLTAAVGTLFVVFLLISDSFRAASNLQDLTIPITTLGLVSIGIAFGLICGVIDLSVGSIMGFAGVLTAGLIDNGFGVPGSIIIVLIVGLLMGLVNGLLTTGLRIPSFIITLGTLAAFRGLTELIQLSFFGGISSVPIYSDGLNWVGSGEVVANITVGFFIFVGMALLGYYVLAHSKVGVWFFAVGGNQRAAFAAGISPDRIRILAFLISGLVSALAGVVMTARFEASLVNAGAGFEFEAITAVIIGGASLFGGAGSMIGTMLGVLLLRVLLNGLTHLEVDFYSQMFIRAAIFMIVLYIDATFRQGRRTF